VADLQDGGVDEDASQLAWMMRAWYRVEVTIVTWRLFSSSIHEPSRELNEPYLDRTWLVVQFPTCKLWIFAQDRVPTLPNGCVYLPTEQGNAGQQRGEGDGMKNTFGL